MSKQDACTDNGDFAQMVPAVHEPIGIRRAEPIPVLTNLKSGVS
jgi:hypothetical protein